MSQAVTFHDLLSHDPKRSPADSQRRAAAELPDRVRRSALAWWPDCTNTNGTGRRLVIGVAVWSNYDLRLLDLASQAVVSGMWPDLSVAVFDLDELVSPLELQRILTPGGLYEPPPRSYWAPGQSKDTATRFAAALQRIFPGIGEVYHSPIVGYWEAGELKETKFGFYGRQLVGQLLGFDPKFVLEQPAAAAG